MSEPDHSSSPCGPPRRERGPVGVRAGWEFGPVHSLQQASLAVEDPALAPSKTGSTTRAESRRCRSRPV
jgi:hypothetical protein